MPFQVDIMWDDLTENAKQEIRDKAAAEGYPFNENDYNWESFPIATLELGDSDEDEDDEYGNPESDDDEDDDDFCCSAAVSAPYDDSDYERGYY